MCNYCDIRLSLIDKRTPDGVERIYNNGYSCAQTNDTAGSQHLAVLSRYILTSGALGNFFLPFL